MSTTYAQPIGNTQPQRGTSRAGRRTRDHFAVPALWRQVVRGAGLDREAARGDDRGVHPGATEPDRSAYTQLEIYEGLLSAFDRRAEVLDLIATSPDRETSVRRLRELLDLSHLQAAAVLDLQLHCFTSEARNRFAHRAAELRTALTR